LAKVATAKMRTKVFIFSIRPFRCDWKSPHDSLLKRLCLQNVLVIKSNDLPFGYNTHLLEAVNSLNCYLNVRSSL